MSHIALFSFIISLGLTMAFLAEFTPAIVPASGNTSFVRRHVVHIDVDVYESEVTEPIFLLTISGGKYGTFYIATEYEEEGEEGYPRNAVKALNIGRAKREEEMQSLEKVKDVYGFKEKYRQLRVELVYINFGLEWYEDKKKVKNDEL
jgi:hypothetical protein